MVKVPLNANVRHPITGEITTINELDKRGLIGYEYCPKFYGRAGKISPCYFANIKPTPEQKEKGITSGWEIRKMAYLSKTNKGAIKAQFQNDAPDYCPKCKSSDATLIRRGEWLSCRFECGYSKKEEVE